MKLLILLLVLTLSGCCSCKSYNDKIAVLEMVRDQQRFYYSKVSGELTRRVEEVEDELFKLQLENKKVTFWIEQAKFHYEQEKADGRKN